MRGLEAEGEREIGSLNLKNTVALGREKMPPDFCNLSNGGAAQYSGGICGGDYGT